MENIQNEQYENESNPEEILLMANGGENEV